MAPQKPGKLLIAAAVGALLLAAYAVSLPPPLALEQDRYLVVPLKMLSRDEPVTKISFAERGIKNEHTRGIYIVLLPDGTFLALSWKDPHLGCTVSYRGSLPPGQTAFRDGDVAFENPCHGEKYDLQGRKLFGPAPRGLDRFGLEVRETAIWVDLKDWREGPVQHLPATAAPSRTPGEEPDTLPRSGE